MSVLRKNVKKVLSKLTRYQAAKKLQKLHDIKCQAADKIANAIEDVLNNNLTSEEKIWSDLIEEERSVLNSDSTKLTFTDYGAGSSDLSFSEKEMDKGVLKTSTVKDICIASKSQFWALILFKLIREFEPSTSIELGTCLGISAAYQAAAHKLNGKGNIITLEGAESIASIAQKNLHKFGLDNVNVVIGRFQDTLDKVIDQNKPIDYVFIDGHHDEKATISYFNTFLPNLSKLAVVVFDDISWTSGMQRAWKEIVRNENVKISVNLRTLGICIIDPDLKNKYNFNIPMI